ncbi:MAG: tRNA epoxyqueuosine(34) reductase QueG [Acidimicrobiales bacterium]|nr:tRNA epoxyqueuosine(34) reductase QueG [Acidimicrobiales bacterium]
MGKSKHRAAQQRPVDTERLLDLGRRRGVAAIGVAKAEPFTEARQRIEAHKAAGYHGSMSFTFRKPEVSTDPTRSLPDARSLVVAAMAHPVREPDAGDPADAPARVARYVWDDTYAKLEDVLREIAESLNADGWRSRVLCDDNALVDREAAIRAGLGWRGKNSNVLVPGFGSWVVLGSVLTDAELTPTAEPVPDGCGPCDRCIGNCPTGAIVAPGVLDARRCLAWLVQDHGVFPREFRTALGDRIYGCDDCQTTCPPNRRAERTIKAAGAQAVTIAPRRAWVPVIDLLAQTDDELLARHGAWYIPKRDPLYLRRNALIVLGNVGDGRRAEVRAAIRAALDHPSSIVRAHAVWAAAQLGLDELADPLRLDPDPIVQAEFA